MSDEWFEVNLGDIAKWSSGGTPSKGKPEYWNGDIPWISASSMDGNRYRDSSHRVTQLGLESGTRLADTNSILLLVRGSILHQKIQVGIAERPVAFNQDVKALEVNSELADPWYLLFWFMGNSTKLLGMVENTGIGAGKLDTKRLQSLCVRVPPAKERARIVRFLKALDDKIEFNRQINTTLESMAQALFKSWFVDFDPVIDNALAAGNDIPEPLQAKAEKRQALGNMRKPLPDGLQQQFPDRFVFTEEMGWVPEGWRVCSLIEMIKLIGGGTPKTSVPEYWGGDIPWFSVVDAPRSNDVFCIQTEKHTTEAGVENSSTKVLRVGTTIISARGTVGKCAIAGVPMAMNQSCYGIEGAAGYTDYFVYYSVLKNVADLQQRSHGSVFSTITRGTFETIKVPGVPASMAAEFDGTVGEFMKRIVNNLNQISALSKLRDTLLPKLLSGELRISEAESQVAEAV